MVGYKKMKHYKQIPIGDGIAIEIENEVKKSVLHDSLSQDCLLAKSNSPEFYSRKEVSLLTKNTTNLLSNSVQGLPAISSSSLELNDFDLFGRNNPSSSSFDRNLPPTIDI